MSDETRRIVPPEEPGVETDEPTIRIDPVEQTTPGALPEVDEPTVRTAPIGKQTAGDPPEGEDPAKVDGKGGDVPPAQPGQPEEDPAGDWPNFDWQDGFSSWTEDDIAGGAAADAANPAHLEAPLPEEAGKPEKKQKKHTLAGALLGALAYLFGVLLVSYGLATLGWDWANDVLALNKTPLTVSVTVEETDTIDQVAATMKESGLIEHPLLFKLYAIITHKTEEGKIVAGTYELNTDMDYSALLTNIGPRSPSRETVKVMIPEGSTLEETFALLEENGVCTAEDLKAEAENGAFDYDFLEGVTATGFRRLEGYLFPDTYEFYKKSSASTVLTKLLDNYKTRFDEEMAAKAQSLGLTQNEIMIVASIIEKETDGSDQNDIASVIYNRLSKGNRQTNGYLQMDSTIQYLLPERKENLTNEDFEIDSPYNTYKYPGLPEGCICCPGLKSIRAALNPSDTNYYFFVLGSDGATHFFESYNDFISFVNSQDE